MQTCIFQLYAPLVSWGEIAVGGERRSSTYPSRSAIIGLVAAAMGIKRQNQHEQEKLSNALLISVRVNSSGSFIRDYHTTQTVKRQGKITYYTRKDEMSAPSNKIGTILSNRQYRCDAYSLVAIQLSNNSYNIENIASALKEPVFHLYFGRKSAPPALPLAPQLLEADTLIEAFDAACFPIVTPLNENAPQWQQDSDATFIENILNSGQITYYWEPGINAGIEALHTITCYDEPISRDRWQFAPRHQCMAIRRKQEA